MICVGSVGNRALRQLDLGFDGNRAGRGALPVAVMRSSGPAASDINWIVVRMTDTGWQAVLEYAGAKVRQAPMLALGGRPEELREFQTANSNVACRIGTTVIPMCASTRSPLTRVLPGSWPTDERVQLAVIGGGEPVS